jgi:heme exporter protein D
MDLGPHAAFIIASYAVVAIVMAGLITWLILDGRRHQRALDALEARGVRRRSQAEDSAR